MRVKPEWKWRKGGWHCVLRNNMSDLNIISRFVQATHHEVLQTKFFKSSFTNLSLDSYFETAFTELWNDVLIWIVSNSPSLSPSPHVSLTISLSRLSTSLCSLYLSPSSIPLTMLFIRWFRLKGTNINSCRTLKVYTEIIPTTHPIIMYALCSGNRPIKATHQTSVANQKRLLKSWEWQLIVGLRYAETVLFLLLVTCY